MRIRRQKRTKKTIVDFGTGRGHRAVELAKKNPRARVIGIDHAYDVRPELLSAKMKKEAQTRKNLEFKFADFTDPKLFKKKSIDIAELNWSLFPKDKRKILRNLLKWLSEDSEVRIRLWPTDFWRLFIKGEKMPTVKEALERVDEVANFLRKNGFRVVTGIQHTNYKRPHISDWEESMKEYFKSGKKGFYPIIIARRGKSKVLISKGG